MKTVLAFAVAILVPTIFMVGLYLYGQFTIFEANDPYIWVRTSKWFVMCLVVSGVYVVVLGIPAYLIMRWLKIIRWWSTIIAGSFLGAVPMAIFSWPLQYSGTGSSSTINGVETLINGVPTTAGWLQYFSSVTYFGGFGAVSALAFWLVVRNVAQQGAPADHLQRASPASGGS